MRELLGSLSISLLLMRELLDRLPISLFGLPKR
jgi:hypothetical protein